MAGDAEDCGFQMLNDVEIGTSVQEESNPVGNEMDEDEDNKNNEVERVHHASITRFLQHVHKTNNASQLNVRKATTSDCHRNCSRLRPRRSLHSQHQWLKDCRTSSNKFDVPMMSIGTPTIREMRSSTAAIGVS
ncbi:hypothetical protein TNCV_2902611 [Trichonephila clavipes]|nr:hypothetical protein TNCV_2902611 [Trichonephila clavipes]